MSLFGPKRVYYIIGKNKIASDLKSAMERARNVYHRLLMNIGVSFTNKGYKTNPSHHNIGITTYGDLS